MSDEPKVKQVEHHELIASRVPPGDKWTLVNDEKRIVHPTLMDTLEAYYSETQFKGDFRFSPREGKIFIITVKDEVIPPKPEKKYNIYGDPM
ncbi:hypothetical protein E2P64_07760 [Candidatus Bathyarchaeota archaeon]|nr:hypothetical protein E2P64_07760 [Candidatus Bathyarchaeota archaeon]